MRVGWVKAMGVQAGQRRRVDRVSGIGCRGSDVGASVSWLSRQRVQRPMRRVDLAG
jgi:hypothetical protein